MSSSSPAAPWLSILIPVYNVRPYLQACLDSVLPQAAACAQPVEVIALDDQSNDGSWELLQQLQQAYPALRILRHEHNGGLSRARNTLLEAATGDYLWFLDSDDLLADGAVASLHAAVAQHAQPDLVICGFRLVREVMKPKHVRRGELHRATFAGPADQRLTDTATLLGGLMATGQMHSWSKIARRHLYGDDLRFPPGRHYEDMATTPRLALRAASAVYVPQVWVGYRQRAGSILATLSPAKLQDLAQCWPEIARAVRARPNTEAQVQAGVAQFIARSFLGAVRKVPPATGDGPSTRSLRLALDAALNLLGLDAHALATRFLRQGWFWRAARLRYWLWKTRR
ncbi:MAG: putative glycosyltransferase EpsJ [Paracidovorax wautersii]|uniref:Putative glycosyltransferase EpsJ n=1 Tax=Paracidovorax wautersii TaxID=1177982 RepID=A0A7V8FM71_9BURK|nr:MAG: putative glycosyltransferase EpsJ [Paracidovorax wautersii]